MIEKEIEDFDIGRISASGQCFRMEEKTSGIYCLIAKDKYLEVIQEGSRCCFDCDEEDFEHFWKNYFDLETDYRGFREKISSRDKYLKEAAAFGAGIRILNQDVWEMLISFLISQQNNIVRIRRCIQNICRLYGEGKTNSRGEIYYTFPKPEALAGLGEDDLKACNLGYRSKYVVRAAKSVVSGTLSLDKIGGMNYRNAREALLEFYGVGEKVADCICLFGLHHMEAFPVDTHIRQALKNHYPKGFPKVRYKGFEGVMQQYIFYYELMYSKGR